MIILGVETTCDETGVGIVRDGKTVLANVVSSSADLHKKYRGVVPEIAAREQVRTIIPEIREALYLSDLKLSDIDALAVAYGPGLIGSLLVGVETARVLALALGKVIIPVNHLVAHIYASWISEEPKFPLIGLIISGGHTDLVLMSDHSKFSWLGGTRDDSVGEAFDKVARILGLSYPGGPEIERVALKSIHDNRDIKFPRPMVAEDNLDFSFSGLKTAVKNYVSGKKLASKFVADVAFGFQEAAADVLCSKVFLAVKKYRVKSVVVGGGVAANDYLRLEFVRRSNNLGVSVLFPEKELAVDNGAMIAVAAFFSNQSIDPVLLNADPSLHFL